MDDTRKIARNYPNAPDIGQTIMTKETEKPRILLGWHHTEDNFPALDNGKLWCWVSEGDREQEKLQVYDQEYNRSKVPGEYRNCGVANFTMVRMFHPYFCPDEHLPVDQCSDDKRRLRQLYQDYIRQHWHPDGGQNDNDSEVSEPDDRHSRPASLNASIAATLIGSGNEAEMASRAGSAGSAVSRASRLPHADSDDSENLFFRRDTSSARPASSASTPRRAPRRRPPPRSRYLDDVDSSDEDPLPDIPNRLRYRGRRHQYNTPAARPNRRHRGHPKTSLRTEEPVIDDDEINETGYRYRSTIRSTASAGPSTGPQPRITSSPTDDEFRAELARRLRERSAESARARASAADDHDLHLQESLEALPDLGTASLSPGPSRAGSLRAFSMSSNASNDLMALAGRPRSVRTSVTDGTDKGKGKAKAETCAQNGGVTTKNEEEIKGEKQSNIEAGNDNEISVVSTRKLGGPSFPGEGIEVIMIDED